MQKERLLNGFVTLKAIFFDMDGVIYDSMGNHSVAWSKAFAHLGWDFPLEQVYLNEGRTGSSTIHLLYKEKLGRLASDEEIGRIYEKKSELFDGMAKPKPLPGISGLMEKAKRAGLEIWVVTGSGQAQLLEELCADFLGLIEKGKIISGFDVKHGKPHPEPYLTALARSGFQADQVVVIENAPLGIEAAKAAGIYTIAINTGILSDDILWKSGADAVVKGVGDVEKIIFTV
ncbi:MAG: HAD family phosphatase [Bacteroidia bacterium]|nr:HAD family phosphatase [Bacteroidia bacterium]